MTDFNAYAEDLRSKLSQNAQVSMDTTSAPRWSEYNKLDSKIVVHAAEETDVAITVKHCVESKISFLVQGGGHNWSKLKGDNTVIINMRGLNSVTVSEDKQTVTYGGGAIVKEVNDECFKQGVQVALGICNDVGGAASLLGGGIGRNLGQFSCGVDNLVSATMIDATGTKRTVTSENKDLWWAIRGAGPNFGAFTSITIKAYPLTNNGNSWTGALVWPSTSENLEKVLNTIKDFKMTAKTCMQMFLTIPPPATEPMIVLAPYYDGTKEEAEKVYADFFALDPVMNQTGEMPLTNLNDSGDPFCLKGGRKPATCVGMKQLDIAAFQKILKLYQDFIKANAPAARSTMLLESYSTDKMMEKDDASFPHRDCRYYCLMIPWYDDSHKELDTASLELSHGFRDILSAVSGYSEKHTYINFAHGDEALETVYGSGERLERLKKIKKQYDPDNIFGSFFPII